MVHSAAQQGYSSEAEAYARGRPEYPMQIMGWLSSEVGIDGTKHVVDLGAGTGKFTSLLTRLTSHIIAIEPVAAMRAELHKRLSTVVSLAGTAEHIPLDTASVDVVVCAQAFHWFATEHVLAEIHRVLKPGGKLALVWNVRDTSVAWVDEISKIITPYENDAPRYYKGDWRKPFATGKYFGPLQQTIFRHSHVGSPQEVIIDRFLSVSFIAALAESEKMEVKERLQYLIQTCPVLGGDEIAFPYATEAYVCSKW